MPTVYLSLTETPSGETRVAAVNFGDSRDGATFEPTRDGLRDLGRYLASHWPDREVFCSSDLDFPHEFGIALDADEIRAAIVEGESDPEVGYGPGIGHLFS